MIIGTGTRTRADRLRLVARLERARRATDLLRSKEESLERERTRLEGHAVRAQENWAQCSGDAASLLVRARMLGASDELTWLIVTGPPPASITPDWQTSMGVVYPGSVACDPGARPAVVSTAALRPATDAYRQALVAAAQHAAASDAVRRLGAELAYTRRRRRAIEERLLPALEQACHELDLHLDELDREEALRVRTAIRQQEAKRA